MPPDPDRRYALVPQMRDYDRMATEWTPYVMGMNQRNFRSAACTTDRFGLRTTWNNGQALDYDAFRSTRGRKGLVCGGSSLFGVGASSDAQTVPSLLNDHSETTWFNFGARAHNSTQELLLFLQHAPEVDEVVMVSGINTLVTHALSTDAVPPAAPFFEDFRFFELNHANSRRERLIRALPSRFQPLFRRRPPPAQPPAEQLKASYDSVIATTRRDLRSWQALSAQRGFSLTFVLQPYAYWMDKKLTVEEDEIFAGLIMERGTQMQELYEGIGDLHERYAGDLRDACEATAIAFFDSNEMLPRDGWLFSDRVHLTDGGNRALAAAIASVV
jgi:hypothetical protein